MEFSKRQKELIHAMIQQESESIRDFYGDGPGYHIFLENHLERKQDGTNRKSPLPDTSRQAHED